MTLPNASSFDQFWLISCYFSEAGVYIMPTFTLVWIVLFLLLCFLILFITLQRWRQNKLSPVSHADFFTYNALSLEFVRLSGYIIYCYSLLGDDYLLQLWGLSILTLAFPGILWFHLLTCIERYLAVVYPVLYLRLKEQRWLRLRYLLIVLAWVLCFAWIGICVTQTPHTNIVIFVFLIIAIAIIVFCSVQVLRALKNPSPTEGGGVSQSKQRAFYTILVILCVELVWVSWGIFFFVIEQNILKDRELMCELQKSLCWFELPSSLVLPVLFVLRSNTLHKCQSKNSVHTSSNKM